MIVELGAKNLAIFESASLSLGPGLTVLTGETGAGKSLIVDALELVLGDRADSQIVRSGATKATIDAVIDVSSRPDLEELCAELGITIEEGRLFLRREIGSDGKTQARICGSPTPVGTLRSLGKALVDFHGQHEHQDLLDASKHLRYLDAWVGQTVGDLLSKTAAAHAALTTKKRRLAELRASVAEREQRIDLLRFQVGEIDAAALISGESMEIERRLKRLKHVGNLVASAYSSVQALTDSEGSAVDRAGEAVKSVADASRFDPGLADVAASLRDSQASLSEAAHFLRQYADNLQADPQELERQSARLDQLKRLLRKYGSTEQEVLAFAEQARRELETLEAADANLDSIQEDVARQRSTLNELAAALSAARKCQASLFQDRALAEFSELGLDRAAFLCRFATKEASADGMDEMEFEFSANPGEAPRPLARVASGGEASRVMLALKTVLAGKAGVPSLVFDEVDSGLSGRAAAVVGKKLKALSKDYQVIVISHLPQIAALAHCQIRVEKEDRDGRTYASLKVLDSEARELEIARMLAGESVTEAARHAARDLIAEGSEAAPASGLF